MTAKQARHRQSVGHMTFETLASPAKAPTFALYVKDMITSPAPLFSGHITQGMGSEMRRLASHFDELERSAKNKEAT